MFNVWLAGDLGRDDPKMRTWSLQVRSVRTFATERGGQLENRLRQQSALPEQVEDLAVSTNVDLAGSVDQQR